MTCYKNFYLDFSLHAVHRHYTMSYNGIMNLFPASHSMFAKINTNSYIPVLNLCIRHASKFISVFVHIPTRLYIYSSPPQVGRLDYCKYAWCHVQIWVCLPTLLVSLKKQLFSVSKSLYDVKTSPILKVIDD